METSTTSIPGLAPCPRITFAARASGRCCPRFWSINSRDCATATNLQENVFFFTPSICGHVFLDANANGRQDRREPPMRGIMVQLLDAEDNVIATTVTGRDGSYSFKELDLGTYRVRLLLPAGVVQTTRNPRDITMKRDADPDSIDFGVRLRFRSVAQN